MKTKYQKDFPARVREYAAQGMLDTEMARALGVSTATFYEYQTAHPEFAEAIKEGKKKPNEEVAAAMFKAALGYTVQERHVELGPNKKPRKVVVVDKFIPPNITAGIFFLKNRDPKNWRDVHHQILKGEIRTTPVDYKKLSLEELKQIEALVRKAGTGGDE